jgi:hypothetical protein
MYADIWSELLIIYFKQTMLHNIISYRSFISEEIVAYLISLERQNYPESGSVFDFKIGYEMAKRQLFE